MRIAYADPPYPGTAHRYPEKKEVNHRLLIAHLQEFDGWALSSNSQNLQSLIAMCPEKVRTAAWCKTNFHFCFIDPGFGWEPVLFRSARNKQKGTTRPDWFIDKTGPFPQASNEFFLGRKPDGFCFWLFYLLGAEPTDDFYDLFPGSGAVTRAWDAWKRQTVLPLGI